MKTAFLLVVLAVVPLSLANIAQASATNWMSYVQADSIDGLNSGIMGQLGVKPTALDTWDPYDGLPIDFDTAGTDSKWVAFPLSGDMSSPIQPNLYSRSYMSTSDPYEYPAGSKTWSFKVAGLSASTGPIRLRFKTGSLTSTLPPAPGLDWRYYWVRLVDNRGQVINKPSWAGAGGGVWDPDYWWGVLPLAVPATTNTYFGEIILPELRLSENTNTAMLSEGYEFQFIYGSGDIVPEPASLFALGSMFAGLALYSRRRLGRP